MPKTLEDLLAAQPAPVVSWYAITAEAASDGAPTRAKINIYDAIGGWWGTNASDFVAELDGLDVDELEVHVNSPGGAVWDGIAIMNSLKKHRARVTVIVDGLAASAASIVAMAGDEVVMAEGSQMMVHQASGGAWGNAETMRDMVGILDKIDVSMAAIYARRAGGTRASWLDVMRAETWYTAEEAVEAGLADRAEVVPDAVDAEAAFDLSIFTYAGRSHAPSPRRPAASLRPVAMANRAPHSPASTSEPGSNNRKEEPLVEEFLNSLRQRLGVNSEASAEDILAALDETLAEQAEPQTAALPAGVIAIERGVLDQLKADASAGRQARDQLDAQRRDGLVTDALKAGKITAAQRQQWRDALDKDETGITTLLASLAAGTVPVEPKAISAELDADEELYNRAFPKEA